jgi:hypothetical protein
MKDWVNAHVAPDTEFPFPQESFVEWTRQFVLANTEYAQDLALHPVSKPTKVLWARVTARSWAKQFGSGFDALPYHKAWQEVVDDVNKDAPPSAAKAWQTSER